MAGLEGQRVVGVEDLGAIPVSNTVKALVGTTATVLTKPAGAKLLVLVADKGAWRFRIGSVAGSMPAAVDPAASVTDGTAGVKILEGSKQVLSAPGTVTVKGYNATDVLTYYWV